MYERGFKGKLRRPVGLKFESRRLEKWYAKIRGDVNTGRWVVRDEIKLKFRSDKSGDVARYYATDRFRGGTSTAEDEKNLRGLVTPSRTSSRRGIRRIIPRGPVPTATLKLSAREHRERER